MAASIIECPQCGTRNRVPPRAEGVPRCASCDGLLPWLVDADVFDFDAEIKASVPVLLDLWAPWCGPCRWVSPIIEDRAREHAGKLKVVRVNVDEAERIRARYDVLGIPTLILLRDSAEVDRLTGAPSKAMLESWLERHLGARATMPS